ncbi:ribosome maturation factor RimM [Helicobacter sp. 11S02596-1]|uniref:ribosome maturation factor RimM n=1 Tax=Helicobacter sp. 11S02596-1 TaxID=1476194 RepID=UPI000BA73F40|nr:ribosome maturation factor RimM [Helicobacter sp. 11S02596-1]PAF43155.1 16S rRNA processing protein RimM [Helicobacter sp. 11S02596-1]
MKTPSDPAPSTAPAPVVETLIEVGKIGKTIGLNGGLKFHLTSDFPQSIQENLQLTLKSPSKYAVASQISRIYTIKSFNPQNSVIFFKEIHDINAAKMLCHCIAYASLEDTKKHCHLGTDEYFWFDVIGCEVLEDDENLGEVRAIERIGQIDYLLVTTSEKLRSQGLGKTFMIPYIKQFILTTSLEQKIILTKGAKAILEAS